MADFVFIRKSRNKLSSILHVFLNILLGIGSILITIISSSWVIGIILVLISKWRIFAVRPRFWLLNIKSNLVDLIVGASFVLLTYCYGFQEGLLPIHFVLVALYVIWLLFIKPLTTEAGAIIQSLFAVFLGTSAAVLLSSSIDPIILVLTEFLIGYSASRHILAQSQEGNSTILTLTYGLIFSIAGILSSSWSILYPVHLLSSANTQIPQLALILTIATFVISKIHFSIERHDGAINRSDVFIPTIFGILAIFIIIFGFSNPIFNI